MSVKVFVGVKVLVGQEVNVGPPPPGRGIDCVRPGADVLLAGMVGIGVAGVFSGRLAGRVGLI